MNASIPTDGSCQKSGDGDKDTVAELVAAAIRARSATSELMAEAEILHILETEPLALPDARQTGADLTVILTQSIDKNEDLQRITGAGSQYYYSSLSMTEAYAKILLRRSNGPLHLIAETVRQNTHTYQRPVPFDMFTKPPFNLASRQVLDTLEIMAAIGDYNDIETTSTSARGIYLFSTTHLEREYAVMLAEWLDVGQADNP